MWEERARSASRTIASVAADGSTVGELYGAAIDVVGKTVGSEVTCWAAIDPETLTITTMISGRARIPARFEPVLAESEYAAAPEPHRFATLARRGEITARLSDLSKKERDGSRRVAEVWRPLGVQHELRAVYCTSGRCWGGAGFVRSDHDFTDREMEFLAAVSASIGAATRLAVRAELGAADGVGRAAVAIVGPDGRCLGLTPAASEWRDRIDDVAPGRFLLMLHIVAARARTTAAATVRVRDAVGQWAVFRASPLLDAADEQIAVTIDPATGDDVVDLVALAYELSPRERAVCAEVIAGHPTERIARELAISAQTVQDHLKSCFAKVGVRSRGELVARLRPVSAPGAVRSS